MEAIKCQASFLTFIFEAVLFRYEIIYHYHFICMIILFFCTKPCLAIVQQYSMHQTSTKHQRFARKIGLSTAQEGTSASDFLEFLLGYARTQNGALHCTLVVRIVQSSAPPPAIHSYTALWPKFTGFCPKNIFSAHHLKVI